MASTRIQTVPSSSTSTFSKPQPKYDVFLSFSGKDTRHQFTDHLYIVALTGNAETNILACLTAKKLGVRKTVAMVENLDYVSMAEGLDIGTIINKKTVAASHIYQMMLDADVSNLRSLMLVDSEVAEFVAAEGSRVTKRVVKDLGLPFGVTIGGLVRDGVGLLVSGNSQILPGDSVMVFCHETKLNQIEKFFKKNTLW